MKQSHSNTRPLFISLSILLFLSLTGCWSSHEIEEQSLGIGMAFDKGKKSFIENELNEQGEGYLRKDLITSTYQLITPQVASSTTKQAGPQQKSYLNVSETGDSILQMTRELSLRSEQPLTAHHMKVIVISDKLAKSHGLEKLLDLNFRDNDFRPSCIVLISNGRASNTLETKKAGEIPAFRLIGIVENAFRTTRILPPMSLIKIESKLNSESSFLLQNVLSVKGEVKFAGAAVIKGKTHKMAGTLNEEELEGVTWITGKGKGGVVKSYDKETGQLIVYEIESMKSTIIPRVKGDSISFDVNIESVGRLSENWVVPGDTFKNEFLKKAEKSSEKEVKRLVGNVLEKMQKEYQVDVAGFGNRLRIEHPKVWNKVKKDWDQTFSEAPINYDVNLTINDYGTTGGPKK
ncbi:MULTISPECIES: Ger(x)C family spore germination protein [unclassified Bacillus (in: firmicutes)]|uniref:Ger(x)C family spore germination protein n=1 Tax=unclassified Bacillus (in: firmicutes) TaxID=185979 RepID=UPI001BE9836A|nr:MULTISPECIES: Ger(x)C family spore germination protein [unclassified Bacillus (in: firmicutes)]MBT2617018.1 Ger(x)C family spore germination protein [Bacillus sp. ISL-78]MBT2630511.1 Ger(x)C family spore germination protein [Bacillus sp. ISL-101]MBT2716500.1 Ger(x)C family spore germination protein [Bacillus sp. ISL-57]